MAPVTKDYKSKVRHDLTKGMKDNQGWSQVKDLQRACNVVFVNWGFPWRKIRVDGDLGPATIKAVNMAGWILGLSRKQLGKINNGRVTKHAQKIIRRERKRDPLAKRRQKRRTPRIQELRRLHHDSQVDHDGDGLAVWGGVTVDAEFVPWLNRARANGWQGSLTSGYRTPEYSESLCYGMCGAPACPGRCAGRRSRHSQKYGEGAIDATHYVELGQIFKRIGAPFFNSLGSADPVHFSKYGN